MPTNITPRIPARPSNIRTDMDEEGRTLADRIEITRQFLVMAAHKQTTDDVYINTVATELRQHSELRILMPDFLKNYVAHTVFFADISSQFRSYHDRETHIKEGLQPVLDWLQGINTPAPMPTPPSAAQLTQQLNTLGINLPDDLLSQATQMAQSYATLFIIENTLRHLIDRTLSRQYGQNYWENGAAISSGIKKKIENNKQKEASIRWLQARGNDNLNWQDLYYIDFADLAKIIHSNQLLFQDIFPDEHWLQAIISDMAMCRHLIAHCCFANDDARSTLISDFKKVMRQIGYQDSGG